MQRQKNSDDVKLLVDNNLHGLVTLLNATKKQIKSLQLKEKELTEQLKADMSDIEGGKAIIESMEFGAGASYTVSMSETGRNQIDREMLLELGVTPGTISQATKSSKYTTLRITENKTKE